MNLTYPVDALVSFHYYRKDEVMAPVAGPGHLRLIADSGAFSAYTQGTVITVGEYVTWCQRWRKHLAWIAALDVIGDPAATMTNWRAMLSHGLPTVPTLHAGGDVKWLDAYAAEGVDFLGLGGLVGVAPRAFAWLVHVFRYARDHHPGMRFHLWGVTNRKLLAALPAYSADSSGIMGQSYRYGTLRLFNPRTAGEVAMKLDGRTPLRHRDLLAGVYGVEPKEILTSRPANRVTLIRLAAASVQQYAGWLQRRHHVTPPTWGLTTPGGTGPRVHLVDAAGGNKSNRMETALLPGTGPHIHVIGNHSSSPSVGGDDLTALGPHVHVVDAMPAHLAALNPQE